jgi:glycosyltransferase involved in cell wall biosynthesis
LLGLKAILKTLRDFPNVKIYHFNAAGPALFGWIARLAGKKTIYVGHGLEWKRTKWSKFQQKVLKVFDRSIIKYCTKYHIAVSQEQSVYWSLHLGIPFITIPTAVNPPKQNVDVYTLKKFSLLEEEYYLYLGRLVQDKNPDFLIKAFCKAQLTGVKLVMAGSNDTAPEYVSYLKSLANENVVFTGAVYGDDKEALLKYCKAFCIPSTIEGLAITLLEAMSYGKLCIASDITANKEGLGDNGVWVKPEDVDSLVNALKYVNENNKQLRELGLKNRKRVEDYFLWDKVSQRYSDFINDINN